MNKNQGLDRFTAFTSEERLKFGLQGLLPPTIERIDKQARRELIAVRSKTAPIEKYIHLQHLAERNETLFYHLMLSNIKEMMPLVYTPVVGEACRKWSNIMLSSRGIVITIADLGNISNILRNWSKDVNAIVVTDGERILGLGDLGYNGIGIPVGKLQLYTACGGVNPSSCLPIILDVGTNNKTLRNDEFYQGVNSDRVRGEKYDALIEEFMNSVVSRWGRNCLIQFEDFGNTTAFNILKRYRDKFCCFNDDIQGTAAVTLAGIISSIKLTSKGKEGAKCLSDHTYLFYGAGEAAVGIADLIVRVIVCENRISIEKAREKIWLVDSQGLIWSGRKDKLAYQKIPYAHDLSIELQSALDENGKPGEYTDLVRIVKVLHASCLIGVAAQSQAFTKPVIEALCENVEHPIVFPLSNPTEKCECTPEQALGWSNGKVIIATGSPFEDVVLENPKRVFKIGQSNNSYIFPGLALGIILGMISVVPDDLLQTAAQALAEQVSNDDLSAGSLFPPLANIREVSAYIAARVIEKSYDLGISQLNPRPENLLKFVKGKQYLPIYNPLI